MKISNKFIPTRSSHNWYGFNDHYINNELVMFLVIVNLHLQKKINDARLKAMFSALRHDVELMDNWFNNQPKKFIRKVNTYHCKINDMWYNDESMFVIMLDVYNELCVRQDIELDVLLKYVNLLLNKNKNYCIDWFYFGFIDKLIQQSDGYRQSTTFKLLESFDLSYDISLLTYEEADYRGLLSSGYCCDDCDGSIKYYKNNQYNYYYNKRNKEQLEKVFKEFLLNKKTPSALKNPNEKLKV